MQTIAFWSRKTYTDKNVRTFYLNANATVFHRQFKFISAEYYFRVCFRFSQWQKQQCFSRPHLAKDNGDECRKQICCLNGFFGRHEYIISELWLKFNLYVHVECSIFIKKPENKHSQLVKDVISHFIEKKSEPLLENYSICDDRVIWRWPTIAKLFYMYF